MLFSSTWCVELSIFNSSARIGLNGSRNIPPYIKDLPERYRLVESTLKGDRWEVQTKKGKWKKITDREMVNLSQKLQG